MSTIVRDMINSQIYSFVRFWRPKTLHIGRVILSILQTSYISCNSFKAAAFTNLKRNGQYKYNQSKPL